MLLKQFWSGRRGSNPQHPAWEGKYSALYFQHLQNRSRKICVHALHTVHALPDLRIAAGRFWDGFHDATDRFSLGSLGRASDVVPRCTHCLMDSFVATASFAGSRTSSVSLS